VKKITLSTLTYFKKKLEEKWNLKFSQIYNKTETDELITSKVAEIVANAPEDFDTLKEMSDWLTEHEDSAATMNTAIQKNADDITTANTNIAKKLDKTTKYAISDEVGGAASTVKTTITSVDDDRVVYFGDSVNGLNGGATKTGADSDFYYNPASKKLNVKNIVSDTTKSLGSQIAINKTTLGTQHKNLLKLTQPFGYSNSTTGVNYTYNDDGSITANGTLTGEASLVLSTLYLDIGTYKMSSSTAFNMQLYNSSGYISGSYITTIGTPIVITEAGEYTFRWYWGKKDTVVNSSIKPMLTHADVLDTTYEPFQPSLQEQITSFVEGLTTWTSRGIANVSYLPAEGVTQKVNKTLKRVVLDVNGSLLLGVEANTAISLGNLTSNTYIPAATPRVAITHSNAVIGYVVKNPTNVSVALIAISKIEAGTIISAHLEWTY
jgi:hypothetical protein